MKPKQDNGKPDTRYTVEREYCGWATARYVARFLDKWIGGATTRNEAWELARSHQTERAQHE